MHISIPIITFDYLNRDLRGSINFDLSFSKIMIMHLTKKIPKLIDSKYSITSTCYREKHEVLTVKGFQSYVREEYGKHGMLVVCNPEWGFDLKKMIEKSFDAHIYREYGHIGIYNPIAIFDKGATEKILDLKDKGLMTIPDDFFKVENGELKIEL